MTFPTRTPRHFPAGLIVFLLLVLPLLSGCDEGTLNAPDTAQAPEVDGLFNSYVALGNSITAGFQSGGINRQTQMESYAVLLADSVLSTPFNIPSLNPPGCPAPFERFFDAQGTPDPQRPAGVPPCALRSSTASGVQNVAVPGANTIDVLNNTDPSSSTNQLTQFILGGRTQIEAALDATPTFASVWIGNNDVLDPAREGTANATSPSDFQTQYTQILDSLESSKRLKGGALIGVANPAFIPTFSPGPVYFALDQAGQFPPTFNVDANCDTTSTATGLSPLVPLEYGFTLLGQAAAGQPTTLDCEAPSSGVLTLSEVETLAGTVQQYNAFIEAQANERGFAYLNPNGAFQALYQDSGQNPMDPTDDLIPKFPDRDSDQPFGPFFSLDGFHPSGATHRLITNQLAQAIDQEYGTNLDRLENAPELP